MSKGLFRFLTWVNRRGLMLTCHSCYHRGMNARVLVFIVLAICPVFKVITIVGEPLRSESVDHDGTCWRCDADSKNSSSEHLVAPFDVPFIDNLPLRELGESHSTQSCLYGRLGDPSESHEEFFFPEILLFSRSDDCSDPAECYSDENNSKTQANLTYIDLCKNYSCTDRTK